MDLPHNRLKSNENDGFHGFPMENSNGLENPVRGTVGSNPTLSARIHGRRSSPAITTSPAARSSAMICLRRWGVAALLAGAMIAPPAWAQADEPPKHAVGKVVELPPDATTTHTIELADHRTEYTATAGSLPLRNDKQEIQATVFYVAYTVTAPVERPRPVTFAFNGGPGAASAYLHLGALGPRVVDFSDDPAVVPHSAELVDNAATWLDFTDLVFIDPVGTGYSRAASGVDEAKEFWGVDQDLRSLGQTISLYLAHAGRTTSPVFLAGESYGGFRAARLARSLIAEYGVRLAGATMISPVFDFALLRGGDLDPLPDVLRLPSYAAVMLERQGALTPEGLSEVESFALGDYLVALAGGIERGPGATALYSRLAHFTGLPEDLLRRLRGRIPPSVFRKEFLRGESRILSSYDGAVSAPDPHPESLALRADDPVLDGTRPAFTGAMLAYLRDELGFRSDQPYRLLVGEISRRWDWSVRSPWSSLGASDDLRAALSLNPRFHGLVAHGMTDLQTPYMTSRYVVDHLPEMGESPRLTVKLYRGGHMMYLRLAMRRQLHGDVAEMYQASGG
jgi:carboxypeptidase C (cathepsin A)